MTTKIHSVRHCRMLAGTAAGLAMMLSPTFISTTAIAIVLSVGGSDAQEPLKIGLIQSMTGAFNTIGKAVVNGARL
jgi:hypothetical protein